MISINRYDKEEHIIRDFQRCNELNTKLYPKTLKNALVLYSILSKRSWKKWINSSGKDMLPPDFYNDKKRLMMEVMRVDDHAYVDEKGRVINLYNQHESMTIENLIDINPSIRDVAEQGNLFIIPYTGLESEKDHNYNLYVNNFKRIVGKHLKKIEKYKNNHPGFKTIFFIFDESTPYVEFSGEKVKAEIGAKVHGSPHYWWLDKNMLKILVDSDLDYLIWYTPYKYVNSFSKFINKMYKSFLPKVVVFDIKKIKKVEMIDYSEEKMQSAEL